MEVVRMRLEIGDGHTGQHELIMVGVGDDGIMPGIAGLRSGEQRLDRVEHPVIELDGFQMSVVVLVVPPCSTVWTLRCGKRGEPPVRTDVFGPRASRMQFD